MLKKAIVLFITISIVSLAIPVLVTSNFTGPYESHGRAGILLGIDWEDNAELCKEGRSDQYPIFEFGILCFDWSSPTTGSPDYVFEEDWEWNEVWYLSIVLFQDRIDYYVVTGSSTTEVTIKEFQFLPRDGYINRASVAITKEQFDTLISRGVIEIRVPSGPPLPIRELQG